MSVGINAMDVGARTKMISAKSLNRIMRRNKVEENRLHAEIECINKKEKAYSEIEYYKSLRNVHDFIKNLSVTTGIAHNHKKRTKSVTSLSRAIVLDKLLASGLLTSLSDNVNSYLKRMKKSRSATVSWLTFSEIENFTDSDESDHEQEVMSKRAENPSVEKPMRPFTHVVRRSTDDQFRFNEARFQSKSAMLFPTGNFVGNSIIRRKCVAKMYTSDDNRKEEHFIVLEPDHVQSLKAKDPVFSSRYKKFVNSKLSGMPAKYPNDDALERVTMLKSAIEREKKRIIAGICPERTAVQQFNLNQQRSLDKKIKNYLRNNSLMQINNENTVAVK
jgi:hypothetical protein